MALQGMKGNQVMDMLDEEKRLDKPDACPAEIYEIMRKCWMRKWVHHTGGENYLNLLERAKYLTFVVLKFVASKVVLLSTRFSYNISCLVSNMSNHCRMHLYERGFHGQDINYSLFIHYRIHLSHCDDALIIYQPSPATPILQHFPILRMQWIPTNRASVSTHTLCCIPWSSTQWETPVIFMTELCKGNSNSPVRADNCRQICRNCTMVVIFHFRTQ